MRTAITVGLIGFPNVGKSSVINSLCRVRAAKVGATPGVTKTAQEISLDKRVKLLDTPGIVFPKSNDVSDGKLLLCTFAAFSEIILILLIYICCRYCSPKCC